MTSTAINRNNTIERPGEVLNEIINSAVRVTNIFLDRLIKFLNTLVSPIAILKDKFSTLTFSTLHQMNMNTATSRERSRFANFNKLKPSKGLIKTIVISALFVGGLFILRSLNNNNSELNGGVKINPPLAIQEISKELLIPLNDQEGEEVSNIKFEIEKAEIQDQIVVKGQRANAVDGRVFLIISLKITNDFDQAVEMDTKDYLRLVIDGKEDELLAPEIHNDPVQVQAISTKKTRLGFAIDKGKEDLKLRVGEIAGNKEEIVLDLKY